MKAAAAGALLLALAALRVVALTVEELADEVGATSSRLSLSAGDVDFATATFLAGGADESARVAGALRAHAAASDPHGPWLVPIRGPVRPGSAAAALRAALSSSSEEEEDGPSPGPCGSVAAFLPGSPTAAFLVHIRRGRDANACLERASAAVGSGNGREARLRPVYLEAPLRSTLRAVQAPAEAPGRDPVRFLLPTQGAAASPASSSSLDPAGATVPARILDVHLAPGVRGASVAADLEDDLARLCPSCAFVDADEGQYAAAGPATGSRAVPVAPMPVVAHISALARCQPVGGVVCTPASPLSACGCAVPAALLEALVHHPDVLWVGARGAPSLHNGFARSVLLTSDLPNWSGVGSEFGACGDGTDCGLKGLLPPSVIPALFPPPPFGQDGQDETASIEVAVERLRARRALSPTPPLARASSASPSSSSSAAFDPPPSAPPQRTGASGAAGAGAPTCTTACAGAECGQGFSTCGEYYEDGLSPLPLDGKGQLVAVTDSGIDYTEHPFFLDAALGPLTPQKLLPLKTNTSFRKVVALWSYMDAAEDTGGHGTHVSGSVAGDPTPTATPGDLAIFLPARGLAPAAQIIFSDFECSTPGGCTATAGVFPSCGTLTCPMGFFTPISMSQFLTASRSAGARIITNSWGTAGGVYSSTSAQIDAWTWANPDSLVLFSAGNDAVFASLVTEAASKNVLAVGAVTDGLEAHMANILGYKTSGGASLPPFFSGLDSRSCTSVVMSATDAGFLPGGACPAAALLTDTTCFALAMDSLLVPSNGYDPGEDYVVNLDLALCCGCQPLQMVNGANTTQYRRYLLNVFWRTHVARWKTSFSSAGPTFDGRIKPDVSAPGLDVVSARATGPTKKAYGNFSCPSTATYRTFSGPPTCPGAGSLKTLVGADPAPSAGVYLTTLEPVRIVRVDLQISYADPGYIGVQLIGVYEGHRYSPVWLTIPSAITKATSLSFPFNNTELGPGFSGAFEFFLAPGMEVDARGSLSPSMCKMCYGAISSDLALNLTLQRGSAPSYLMSMSGTSMATPIVAGTAALARQYFTDGFYPSGKANSSAGFAPSGALLKAALINGASATSDAAFYSYMLGPSGVPPLPQLRAMAGFGVPSLVRGLSFSAVGSDTRAAGQLPTLLLPGLSLAKRNTSRDGPVPPYDGVDPSVSDGDFIVFCVDMSVPPPGTLGAGGALPFSVTLVWTDPAGSPAASIALVNDLDLEVTPPPQAGGSTILTYYGNGDPSSASPQRPDRLNNVEKLTFASPNGTLDFATQARISAPWRVVVRGFSVPFGLQAFSLVVTGPGVALASPADSCAVYPSPSPSSSPSPGPATPDTPAAAAAAAAAAEERGLTIGVAVLGSVLVLGAGGALFLCCRGQVSFQRREAGPGTEEASKGSGVTIGMTRVGGHADETRAADPASFVQDYGTSYSSSSSSRGGKGPSRTSYGTSSV